MRLPSVALCFCVLQFFFSFRCPAEGRVWHRGWGAPLHSSTYSALYGAQQSTVQWGGHDNSAPYSAAYSTTVHCTLRRLLRPVTERGKRGTVALWEPQGAQLRHRTCYTPVGLDTTETNER